MAHWQDGDSCDHLLIHFSAFSCDIFFVSILNAKSVKEDLAILKKSSGLTRSLLARRMNLRITPEIIFELDDSMEYGARIDSILKDIMKGVKPENKGE